MNAYIILKDRWSRTLTIPQAVTIFSRNKLFYSDTRYVGTFWATTWEDAKKAFNVYCGYED